MQLFRYVGYYMGRRKRGIVNAEDIADAKNILKGEDIIVTELRRDKKRRSFLAKKELEQFIKDLSKLLGAGLTLYDALLTLLEKYEKTEIYPVLLDLSDSIKKGESFSKALKRHGEIFDLLFCSMIKNAEETGLLKEALDELAKMIEKRKKLKKKLISSLLYPSILAIFSFSIIFLLLFFVVPSISELFSGKELHPMTRIVLATSRFASLFKGYIFGFFIIFLFSILLSLFLKPLKDSLYRIILRLPYIGSILTKLAIFRFSRSFAVLLSSGISYVDGLKLSKEVMKHPLLEEDVERAAEKVCEGEKLSSALSGGRFPSLVLRLLAIAEESAKTEDMLFNIALIYEDELDSKLHRLAAVAQPILLVALGIIVGFIVLSVLLPLTDVGSFI